MSRQILSYDDLGPITSITTPILRPSSTHPLPSFSRDKASPSSPPRKRLRTNNDSDDIPSYPTLSKDNINNGTGTVVAVPQVDNAEWDRDDLDANARKRKKLQRPGNPSGVPWTLHWDAQHAQEVSHDVNGVEVTTMTLAYDEEDTTMMKTSVASTSTASTSANRNAASPRRGGGGGQPRPSVSHRNSNKRNGGGGGGGMNGSTSKTMPPPPSFIGPVIPPSTTEHGIAAIPENSVGSREAERKGRRKNRDGDGKGNRRGSKTKEKEKEAVSLVNEEEWDDSALIDAWNAAEEEYREMNGGKKWRCEPVKHSSLWHDEFHEDTDEESSDNDDDDALQDSLGVIEETVVEQSYDVYDKRGIGHALASTSSTQVLFGQASSSSSGMPSPHPDASTLFGNLPAPVPFGTTRSSIMEEAFRRAQEASYTAGYWTAVYQMHASQKDLLPRPPAQSPVKKLDGNGTVKREDGALASDFVEEEEEGEIEEEEFFLPTQR